ncbi:MAG: aminoglycoside phosphotransferase family protein [Clostridiales bacterium]|nr:aminoglycoside phosphotransferase family protein [Clostridiales bacterium]
MFENGVNTDKIFDGSEKVIGRGAQADVYSFQGYAYKVYRPSYPVEWIGFEKRQQSEINRAGLSPVRYYDTEDPHIVKMDLIEGDTLEKKMLGGFTGGFDLLADMFRKVHRADPSDVQMPRLIDTAGIGLSEEEKNKILPIIERMSSSLENRICHLDMHFLNVMLPKDGSEPVIIDWINSRIAPAVFDYARTYVVLKECAPEVLGLYESAVAADIASLKISDKDFEDAVTVCTVIRNREKNT